MEFDILGLGSSVSPPPAVAPSPRSQPLSKAPSPPAQPPSHSAKPKVAYTPSVSSEDDEEEYQRELRAKKSGLRRTKRLHRADDSSEVSGDERTRAEVRDDDDVSDHGHVSFVRLPLDNDDIDGDSPLINRAQWIEEQMSLREDEYTSEFSLRIFLGSWNVNAKKRHHEADISAWLLPPDDIDDDSNNDSDVSRENLLDYDDVKRTPADIYIIGFQEIVDLNAQSLIVDHSASIPWDQFILQTLHKTGKQFTQIASVHLVGLSMSVFVRDRFASAVSDVRTGTVGTGIMGVGGNKGAVIVRFEVFKSSICVINSHLAAHQKKVSARNRDYQNILKRALLLPQPGTGRKRKLYTDTINKLKLQPWKEEMTLEDEVEEDDEADDEGEGMAQANPAAPNLANPQSAIQSQATKTEIINIGGREINMGGMRKMMAAGLSSLRKGVATTIQSVTAEVERYSGPTEEMLRDGYRLYEADHIFWIGDLNYRLNVSSMSEVHELIDNKRWRKLLTLDQLILEKKRQHAFVGFDEGRIRFPPTYKYKTGTNEYDKDPKKARYPAYCDRIQWCSNDENLIQLYYRRAGVLKASDHKPVMSAFETPIKKDVESKKKALRKFLEGLSERASDCVPHIAVSVNAIDMTDVRFEVPIVKTLIIKNIGQSVVRFQCSSVMRKRKSGASGTNAPNVGDTVSQLQPWLTIDPIEGVVHPEKTIELTLTIFVDRYSAFILNTDEESINSPIIVKFTPRHQAEIAMRGRYMKSVLGADLAWMMALASPVRSPGFNDGRQSNKEQRPAVPFEIYRLVDHIIKLNGQSTKGNFYPPAILEPEDTANNKSYAQFNATPQVRYICEQLDTGRAFDQAATAQSPAIKLPTHFFVQALLYVLHSLHKPLFFKRARSSSPSVANNQGSTAVQTGASTGAGFDLGSWCYEALMDLPADHYRTFGFLISFLREVLKHSDVHGLGAEELSTCVAGSIMHRMPDEPYSDKVSHTPIQIMAHFLVAEFKEFKK